MQVRHSIEHQLQLGHIVDEEDDAGEAFGSEQSPTQTSLRQEDTREAVD